MIYLASYKSTHPGWSGWVNRGIRAVTRSIYSHSEICIGHPFDGPVPCVSASGVDGGVRLKTMQLNPDKWDVLHLPHCTAEDALAFARLYSGAGYDYVGAARFALPWLLGQSKTRWFCSEVAALIMGLQEPWRFSPADLHAVAASLHRSHTGPEAVAPA